jgi:hypothetical protein
MPDNNNLPSTVTLAEGFDPFSDDVQSVQKPAEVSPAAVPNATDSVVTTGPANIVDPVPFTPDTYLKDKFGFDSYDQAVEAFNKSKEAPAAFSFENDMSKTLFDAIKEGKTEDVFDILSKQKKLEKLTTSDVTAEIASDIIKTNLHGKYSNLDADEVDILFYENYSLPQKPVKDEYESDEDYTAKLNTWQSQVDYVNKRMIIDAKVIQPELSKLRSELKLPDIYGTEKQLAKSQEEFDSMQKARSVYEETLNSDFQSFSGFNVSVKDEEVEIPISFNVAEDERLVMKEALSDFDSEAYFDNRWFSADGKPKVQQMMSDKYILENFPKILQKVANEAASQRLLHHLKKTGNISLGQQTPQGTVTQNPNANMDALADWAFSS